MIGNTEELLISTPRDRRSIDHFLESPEWADVEQRILATYSAEEEQLYGSLSTPTTAKKLQQFVQDLWKNSAERPVIRSPLDPTGICDLANFVRRMLHFRQMGYGVATIDKQLNAVMAVDWTNERQRATLAYQLDCKLPSAVFGYLLNYLVSIYSYPAKAFFWTFRDASHPYIEISLLKNPSLTKMAEGPLSQLSTHDTFLVDFRAIRSQKSIDSTPPFSLSDLKMPDRTGAARAAGETTTFAVDSFGLQRCDILYTWQRRQHGHEMILGK